MVNIAGNTDRGILGPGVYVGIFVNDLSVGKISTDPIIEREPFVAMVSNDIEIVAATSIKVVIGELVGSVWIPGKVINEIYARVILIVG
jgi:hypothetical protein